MRPAFAADAIRPRSKHDPGTHAEVFRSGVQRRGSATATSVIWAGHESPSVEFGAERSARRHDHCRATNRWAPCSTGMPLPSVEPATPPTGCGSPQTTAVAAVHGPQQEKQTAPRRSGLEPRTDRSPQSRPHGYAGMSASSAMAAHGARSCASKLLTPRLESKLQQLAVDPRSAPQRVVLAHSTDEIAQLMLDSGPSSLTLGFPAPVGPEPCPMPPQDGGRLHNSSQSQQAWPEPRHPDHQGPVTPPQPQT